MQCRILLEHRIDLRTRLDVGSVVDELLDRNARRQLGQAADVIGMEVSGDQVVDLFDPGLLHCGHDAIGVTDGGGTGVSRIDEHRLARRRNPQLRISALDIDDIDVQCLRRPGLRDDQGADSARDDNNAGKTRIR